MQNVLIDSLKEKLAEVEEKYQKREELFAEELQKRGNYVEIFSYWKRESFRKSLQRC
jgi:hypothetical protein